MRNDGIKYRETTKTSNSRFMENMTFKYFQFILYVLVITFEGGQYGIYGPRVDCYCPSEARAITVNPRAINPILPSFKCDNWLIVSQERNSEKSLRLVNARAITNSEGNNKLSGQ